MADRPWRDDKRGRASGCLDGSETCVDCRELGASRVRLAHFTICQKPWTCYEGGPSWPPYKLCVEFQNLWFDLRLEFEKTLFNYRARHDHEHGSDLHPTAQMWYFASPPHWQKWWRRRSMGVHAGG
eukprot:gene6525-9263_t